MKFQQGSDLDSFILQALREDVGDGDHTSDACIPFVAMGEAKLIIKDNGILAGVAVANEIFCRVDKSLTIRFNNKDGDRVKKGDIAFIVRGKARSILKAERLVLNIMQRMSGIATHTFLITEQLKGLKTKLLDTRKTTPGFRAFEKKAVKIGGGINHRFGLFDMMMVKDNHVDFAGGIKDAILAAQKHNLKKNLQLKIEVEARNLAEVEQIISVGGIHRIMLDNFSIADLKKAVKLINHQFETEASGKITIKNIRSYAKCGVDYVSVGALTHSYKSLDMSLKAIRK